MLVRNVYENVTCFDADRVGGDAEVAVEFAFAGGGVKRPGMPGAGYDSTIKSAVAERTAVVRANAEHRTNFACDVAKCIGLVAVKDFDERTFGKFFEAGEFSKRQFSV